MYHPVPSFALDRQLMSIELPAGLTSLGDGAFSGCSSMISMELPACLTSLRAGKPSCGGAFILGPGGRGGTKAVALADHNHALRWILTSSLTLRVTLLCLLREVRGTRKILRLRPARYLLKTHPFRFLHLRPIPPMPTIESDPGTVSTLFGQSYSHLHATETIWPRALARCGRSRPPEA
jgi:hypothetical protein